MLFVSLLTNLDEYVLGYIRGLKEGLGADDFIWEGCDGSKHGKMKDFDKEYNIICTELNILRRMTDNTEFDYMCTKDLISAAYLAGNLSQADEKMFKKYL